LYLDNALHLLHTQYMNLPIEQSEISSDTIRQNLNKAIAGISDSYSDDTSAMYSYFESSGVNNPDLSQIVECALRVIPQDSHLSENAKLKRLSMIVRTLKESKQILSRVILNGSHTDAQKIFALLSVFIEESVSLVNEEKSRIRKMLKAVEWDQVRALRSDEVQYIADHCDPETAVIVKLLFHTGARITSLLELRHDNIRQTSEGHWVAKIIGKKQEYHIVIASHYARKIQSVFPKIGDSSYVFCSLRTGKRIIPDAFRGRLKRILASMPDDYTWVTPHTFRRSFALYLYEEAGVSFEAIANWLSHSDDSITRKYLNPELNVEKILKDLPPLSL
jgi:integrase